MSLYENRVRIAEEVKEQEALRKKYEIEENVVVGGNAFVTESVARDSRVTVKVQELQVKKR